MNLNLMNNAMTLYQSIIADIDMMSLSLGVAIGISLMILLSILASITLSMRVKAPKYAIPAPGASSAERMGKVASRSPFTISHQHDN